MASEFTSKQPYEAFEVSFDFTDVLGTEDISSATLTAVDEATLADVTATLLDPVKQSNTTKIVTGYVQAGTDGHRYIITCRIVGSLGSLYELDGILPVNELPGTGGSVTGLPYNELRRKFIELSGRYDLVTATWEDSGADFFLNSGQRFLDRVSTYGKGVAKNVQSVVAGTIIVKSYDLRIVQEVWAGNSVDGLIELKRYTLGQMRDYYGKQLSSVDQGTPAYYATAALRPYPDNQSVVGWTGFYDIDDLVLADNHHLYNGIIIMPPPDKTYYVSIVGKFYSPKLSATLVGSAWVETKSFWTENHPDVLLNAALYKLEVFYRNTEGAKDWMGALDLDLGAMDKDLAEESLKESQEMDG